MTTLDDFTPLESLLLFQSLHAWGVEPESFTKISESLNKSSLIDDVPKERFNPASLQKLYLTLLKAEAKQELQEALDREDLDANGGTISPSRKRKAPSPVLPSVEEAARHHHLVPKLVDKLYSRYVEHTTREIEEQEEIYDKLVTAAKAEGEESESQTQTQTHVPGRDQDDGVVSNSEGPATSASGLSSKTRPNSDADVKHDSQSGLEIKPSKDKTAGSRTTTSNATPKALLPQPHESTSNSIPASSSQHTSTASQDHSLSEHAKNLGTPLHETNGLDQISPPLESLATPGQIQSERLSGNESSRLSSNAAQTRQPEKGQKDTSDRNILHSKSSAGASTAADSRSGTSIPAPSGQRVQVLIPPSKGGVILPPFQLTQQSAATPPQDYPHTPVTTHASARSNTGQSIAQSSTLTRSSAPRPRMTAQEIADANTPSRFGGPGVVVTPGSSTAWRTDGLFASTPQVQRPRSESISSISDTEENLPQAKSTSKRGRSGTLSKAGFRLHDTSNMEASSLKAPKRSRAGSRASSTISHVKNEPETPKPDDTEATDQEATASVNIATKRKRAHTDADDIADAPPASPRKGYILATRNFGRSTGSLMNNINTHKHASLFANPIRAKDAEGYSEVVYRPQDLKSIRAMISAGTKAVLAASAEALQSSPGGSNSNEVILQVSADLIPPKAIVNADQLEKEIMRIFANAVMFNPGNEDLVKEAREMSESVEQLISKWRETVLGEQRHVGAVKRADIDTDDDGDTSSVAPGPAKRRRL